MKIPQGIFAVVCIVFTLQFALVDCDQALGTRINNLNLNTIANRDRILGGSSTGGVSNPSASFQIWIKGINIADFNAVLGAVNGAGCSMVSSNINNNARGLPHWNYVVARIKCGTATKWQNLVYNQAFYSRVAFTERSFLTDDVPGAGVPDTPVTPGGGNSGCKRSLTPPPRIAVWQGKVNQHTNNAGVWATDPDGTSGAELLGLGYCQKWFPNTISYQQYQVETVSGWRDAGNTGGPYSRSLMTYECVQPASSNCKKNTEFDASAIPEISEKQIRDFKEIHANMIKSIEQFANTTEAREERQKRYAQLCPAQEVRDQNVEALKTEEEKKALRIYYQEECDPNNPPYYPPPYYPPPYNPPPPSGFQCPEQYVRDANVEALKTEEEKKALRIYYQEECPNPPPPYYPPPPPYVPPSDYQCAEVSENQNAYLTCPYGKVIKKIEFASYGTAPSLGACAAYPTPKLGTCHSGNTDYLVHQKCCGQSSCTVPATNAFFIDPCAGTGKTLRIKVVCDYPSKVECTAPICGTFNENTNVYLTCPAGLTIKSIDFAAYGASPTLYCQTQFAIPGNCHADEGYTRSQIENVCKGQNNCVFHANNGMFGGDPCPYQAKTLALKVSCATHEPYIQGFEQSTSVQPTSNYDWESSNGRPWTNYLENSGWTPSVDYYNSIYGGTFYMIDGGVWESHPELLDYNQNPPVTRVRRLPNIMNPDPAQASKGFIDPDLLLAVGEDAYLETTYAHGTTIASILIGNTLGMARNLPLYHAKVSSIDIGLDIQAFTNALATVNQIAGTGNGHNRPAVVTAPYTFTFGYGYCYADRVNAYPPEPTCTQGILDELGIAYDSGTIVVIPSNNGFNGYDLYTNPQTGYPFRFEGYVPYPNTPFCDPEPITATPINICNTASRIHDMQFNVWDLYYPVLEKTTQKPFVVAAHDSFNRISRFRDIVYNENDDWSVPWWSIGSSNIGPCVDFSSFGVRLSKSAALTTLPEDSHYFPTAYRESPYLISGTSYSTGTAAAITMYTYGRYGGQYYNGQNIENMRWYLQTYGARQYDDFDTCRNNYWTIQQDTTSYSRLKYF